MKQYDYYISLDWSQAKMAIAVSKKVQRNYYDSLVSRGMAPWDARNKVARKIAELALSIMASGKLYQSGRFEKCKAVSGN